LDPVRIVEVRLVGDTLSFDRVLYAPQGRDRSLRRASGLGDQGNLSLDLAYAGELRADRPTLIRIRFVNPSMASTNRPIRLREVRLGKLRCLLERDGFQRSGHRVPLASRRCGDRELEPGSVLADTITVVPPFRWEFVVFRFEWDGADIPGELHPTAIKILRIR